MRKKSSCPMMALVGVCAVCVPVVPIASIATSASCYPYESLLVQAFLIQARLRPARLDTPPLAQLRDYRQLFEPRKHLLQGGSASFLRHAQGSACHIDLLL